MTGITLIILSNVSLHKGETQRKIAEYLNHIALGLIFLSLFIDIIKMNFELYPNSTKMQ